MISTFSPTLSNRKLSSHAEPLLATSAALKSIKHHETTKTTAYQWLNGRPGTPGKVLGAELIPGGDGTPSDSWFSSCW